MKIAVNGFGRIGKLFVRVAFEKGYVGKEFDIAAINDPHDINLSAHLFKYDSTQGRYEGKVQAKQNALLIDDYEIPVVADREPLNLPWAKMGIDIVVECTGAFTDIAGASKHISAGAKKILISAPGKGIDATIVPGVNDEKYNKEKHNVISIGSCTTNCLAPVAKVIDDSFGIESGFMTTVHAYTNDQHILDAHHKDYRRARAGALSIIPTTTGAAKAIGEVIPSLKGKLDGLALRVPVPVGSMNDLSCVLKREAKKEEINSALKNAAEGKMNGILKYSEEPLVSTDIIHTTESAIVDGMSTMAIGRTVKVLSWYDNEWAFCHRMAEFVVKML